MPSQIVSIKLNFNIGEEGKRNALNMAESTVEPLGVNAGKVLGSGGHPRQSRSRNESRPSPELATRCPARSIEVSRKRY